ncbi:hypothetical protein LWI29_018371 [Acer saccharum]|uniref:SANT domain-containing protein n=1 Tax=Acer saccharum TaxID=4024 RepID=A0AA39SYP3_ACESA|nr:hypothetical protein LWI29_018371 [Acer saccharum]
MAPTRKSRSVNKRYINEVSPVKDVSGSSRSKQKKKLSDKSGPQWSKGELQRFYEAYRSYGKDWKKVASQVRNRSVEMVEALYNMNRAYLSLPEGTASVVGLIAMMTDHYNVMEGSDSERESNDASAVPQKSQKRKRAKVQLSASKEDAFQSWSMASSGGCLSLLKRARSDGSQPRAVKKRTPRVPVSYSYKKDDRDNYIPPNRKGRKSDVDADDDDVEHEAALTLTEGLQRIGSPQVSQTPYSRTEQEKPSAVQSWEKMIPQLETAHSKLHDASVREDWSEGRIESKRPENGTYVGDTNSLMDMEGVGTVEVHRKGKKIYGKKMKVEEVRSSLSDDGAEACSGTEEGLGATKGKAAIEVSNVKNVRFSQRGQKKRSKKLFFGDGNSSLDALQTLADLSLMFPDSTVESESSVQLKEDKALDMDDKSSTPEATYTSHHRDKTKLLGTKEKAHNTISEVEGKIARKSKLGRSSDIDAEAVTEVKEQLEPLNLWKRKRKPIVSKKLSNGEALTDSLLKTLESEALAREENKISTKCKRTSQVSAQSKQWKPGRVLEGSSVNNDQKRARIDLVAATVQVTDGSQVSLPTKHRSRRKTEPKRTLSPKEVKSSENIKIQRNKYVVSQQDKVFSLKEKLSCCLSSDLVRKWCTLEWFYSAIDYPWFANREFVGYLQHVGLGHIPRLTRVEWGVIRSSLGKPRRLSERFLQDEREKLNRYRESVRKHYAELRTGIGEGLPRDLPRPLSVGQRVIAIHPKTRELHDGSVLTVDHDRCRVQFDRPEIGVEFVTDIDCMPANPLDNVPEAFRRHTIAADKLPTISKEPQMNGQSNFGGPVIIASSGHLEKAITPMNTSAKQAKGEANCAILPVNSAATDFVTTHQAVYSQAKEPDIRALSGLTRALDKKKALVMELKHTNNDLLERQNGAGGFAKDSESLKKHIATASSALHHVRQRNTYPEILLPPWLKAPANSSLVGNQAGYLDSSYVSQESGSAVVEIVKDSRLKARTMVDTAIKAMSSIKEGEDAVNGIRQTLEYTDDRQMTSDSRVPAIRSPEQDGTDKNEAQIPSELITSCVSTMLMIQTCTERQYPPSDVAQIIDSAVSSLHPCCPQNLPIYREIEMCMGRIKTQILALIPTSI